MPIRLLIRSLLGSTAAKVAYTVALTLAVALGGATLTGASAATLGRSSAIGTLSGGHSYTPGPAPFDQITGPVTSYCKSGQAQVGWYNTAEGAVAVWNSGDNYLAAPSSGHTIFCQLNEKTIGGNDYYEYAAVIGGTESNNCISSDNKPTGSDIGLNGCKAGENYELWLPIIGGGGKYWIIGDKPDSCVGFTPPPAVNQPIYTFGTATGGADCPGAPWQYLDWSVNAG